MAPDQQYTTPGVYITEVSSFQLEIPVLPTALPAFIGYAASEDPSGYAMKKIHALAEFVDIFGTQNTLFRHLQLYFDNGGRTCIVIIVNSSAGTLQGALDVLKEFDEATLLVVPEATLLPHESYSTLVKAMLQHCAAAKNRFAIIDVYGATVYSDAIVAQHRNDVGDDALKYGASYFPFLQLASTSGEANTMIAPSAVIAAIYCRNDIERGVWKSPANLVITGVAAPAVMLGNRENESLNREKSINAIRSFREDELLVWGARTLAGNDNEWRYIAVQRFCSWIKACIQQGLMPLTFEPNEMTTWQKAKLAIENFLFTLWKQGALAGNKTDEAFFVHVGLGQTMTAQDIADGRMIIEVGVAVLRPAEFIILRFDQYLGARI